MEKEPVIEKGIPMPGRKGALPSIAATLRKMDIGDSFVVDKQQCINARVIANRLGMKVSFRQLNDKSGRVWRVA